MKILERWNFKNENFDRHGSYSTVRDAVKEAMRLIDSGLYEFDDLEYYRIIDDLDPTFDLDLGGIAHS